MRLTSRVAAVAILGLLTGPMAYAQATAQAGVQADQRLPESTFMYFSIPNVNTMKERMAKSHGSGMWTDPAFDEFKEELMNALGGQFDEVKTELQENLGVTPMELLQIPSGQVTLAVSSVDDEFGLIAFIDFGDSRRVVDGLMKKMAEAMDAEGVKMETEDFSGTEISVFAIPGADNNPVANSLHYCIRDTELVISTNMALMKNALSNWDGSDADTFSTNGNWAYVKERCGSGNANPAMAWFVDPIGLVNDVLGSGMLPPQAAAVGAFLPVLGLDKLNGMGGAMDMNVGKYDVISKTVYLCKDPSGVLKVMTLKEGDMTPPKWIPKAVAMYSGMNWDVSGAYKAVEDLVDSFGTPGEMASQIDQMANQGPGIHIKNDIIDQLTGKIQMVNGQGGGQEGAAGAAALLSPSMVIALGCKDEAAMNKLLTKLTETAGFPGEVREFRDSTIIEIPNPQGGPTMALTVARGSLMFSTDVKLVEQLARGGEESLVDSAAYKRVAAEFPAKAMALTFIDVKSSYKSMYESFRDGDPAEMFPGMGEMLENIDFSKLPKFDVLAKYMLPSGGYTVTDDRGAYSQTFTLKP
ncbi:MAG: hypothetical protein AB8G99_13390 [Planctomycetaceae bacterium]